MSRKKNQTTGIKEKYTYFQISRKTAFGSPVYVHSHVRSIQYASSKSAYNQAIKTLYDVVDKAAKKTKDHLNQLILYFENKTDDLIKAGYPTKDGKPYGLTNTFKELARDVLKIYDRMINPDKKKRESISGNEQEAMEKILDEVVKQQDKTIQEIINELGNEYSEKITTHFINRLRSMLNTKKYGGSKEKQLTSEKVSLMAAKDLIEKLRNSKIKDHVELKKSVYNDIKKSTLEAINIVKEWDQFLDVINSKMGNLLNPSTKDTQLGVIISALNDGRNRFLKLGLLMEPITAYSGEGGSNHVEYDQNGRTVGITYTTIGRKDKSFELGDKLTTDIKAIVDKTQQIYGISVKLNPTYFRKEKISLGDGQLEGIYKSITDGTNIENANKELVYFLTNYAILSKMYYPKIDTKYRNIDQNTHTIKNGNVLPPIYGNGMEKTVNLWDKIRNMIATNLFIKAVIGSFFLPGQEDVRNYEEEKVRRKIEQQGAPLIVRSTTGEYWTKDMLIYLRDLSDNEKAAEVVENFKEDLVSTLMNNADEIKDQFQLLFKLKVQNALDNPPKSNEDRYDTIYSNRDIRNVMSSIQNAIWDSKGVGRYGIFGSLIKVKRTIKFRYDGRS